MELLKKSVVLYSLKQKCFHIERLEDYIRTNLYSLLVKSEPQYFLIGIFENDNDANQFIDIISKKLKIFGSKI